LHLEMRRERPAQHARRIRKHAPLQLRRIVFFGPPEALRGDKSFESIMEADRF